MLTPQQIQELERLRGYKQIRLPQRGVGRALESISSDLKARRKGIAKIGTAWEDVVPPDLRAVAEPIGIARGTLTVRVTDAAAQFQLDRFLKSGGEAELARRSPTALRAIKIVL